MPPTPAAPLDGTDYTLTLVTLTRTTATFEDAEADAPDGLRTALTIDWPMWVALGKPLSLVVTATVIARSAAVDRP